MPEKRRISSYGIIAAGTFFMAAGTNIVYEPMHMVTGGFAGIGIVLQQMVSLPLWFITAVLNIPLFVAAFFLLGRHYVGKTLFASAAFSVLLAFIPEFPIVHSDYLMAAVIGGTLNGAGLALVFREGASTGGTDLLAALLKLRFPSLSSGTILAVIDGLIVTLGTLVFGLRAGIYAVLAVFLTSRLMDRILEGMHFAKLLYIVSEKNEEIAEKIMETLDRGVTALQAVGMYSGKKRQVLMCVVSRKEEIRVLQLVRETDERGFVVVSDAREVFGEGFETNG